MTTLTATRLGSVDWSFVSAKTQLGPHGIHPYPAKFIPQIPQNLIRLFPPPDGTCVLDPFCGSGTTLVEAMNAGLPSVGVDLSPIACLIAKVKTTPLGSHAMATPREVRKLAEARLAAGTYRIPEIPRLDHWFRADVQAALASLIDAIAQVSDHAVRDALRVALSAIIVRVSNQDSDTRYAAIEKNVNAVDVLDAFEQRAREVVRCSANISGTLHGPGPCPTIINQDVLSVTPDQLPIPVGLVVTSPPYPNAYEYWLYHKYRMYWLGMDPIGVREKEIGARAHFFRGKNAHTAEHFLDQVSKVFELLASTMDERGVACFLIGRSLIRGKTVDNLALLTTASERSGFRLVEQIERTISRTRKAFNLSHAAIEQEHIAVFQRAR